MSTEPPTSTHAAAVAISDHLDSRTAAMEVADRLGESMTEPCDLVLLFGSFHHCAAFADAADLIRTTLTPTTTIGVTGESVLGDDQELEGRSGLAALALRLPGVEFKPWTSSPNNPLPFDDPIAVAQAVGVSDHHRVTIMFADPFTAGLRRLVPSLTECRGLDNPVPVVGGIASAAAQPGRNVLVINDEARTVGAVGVSLSGALDVDFVVSQGCRPIGKPMVITKAKDNMILELGGTRAIDAVQQIASELPDDDKRLLSGGLLFGLVIDEQKSHVGRGDFLVRNIVGVDQRVGGIVVGDRFRMGRTVQLHVRDAQTASEDLSLLLDAQQFSDPPLAGLLFTCNGRGSRLFDEAGHDLHMFRDRLGEVPMAGFFAAGEIGPVAGRSFVHGQTACAALLRPSNG